MADPNGGARRGPGRPRNEDRHAGPIASFTDLAARGLSRNFDNLCTLADGGWEQVETRRVPAGLVTRKDLARDADGEPIRDDKGKCHLVNARCYPELPPDELVTVEVRVRTIAPDFRANEYLANRVMGVPDRTPPPDAELLEIREIVAAATGALAARRAREAIDGPPAPPARQAAPPEASGDDDEPE